MGQNNLTIHDFAFYSKIAIAWYLIGYILYLSKIAFTKGEITVRDIKESFGPAIGGPILVVIQTIIILSRVIDIIGIFLDSHENRVIWRSKKNRNKHILFGDNDKQG